MKARSESPTAAASRRSSECTAALPVAADIGLPSSRLVSLRETASFPFLDGSQRDFIHARRSLVAAHLRPRSPQDVTPIDPVIQCVKPPCPAPLGTHP